MRTELDVESTANDHVFPGFAFNVTVGTEVELTSDNSQIFTFKAVDVVNPSIFSSLPEMTPEGTLTFRTVGNYRGVSIVTMGLFTYSDANASATRSFTLQVRAPNVEPSFMLPWSARCLGSRANDCTCSSLAFPERSLDCQIDKDQIEGRLHA
jgi:hypothetical protein